MIKYKIYFLIVFLNFSCQSSQICKEESLCAIIKKYKYKDHQNVCITLINKSNHDYYITGLNRLVFGLNVTKRFNGAESDARFEFYKAPYKMHCAKKSADLEKAPNIDYSEEREKCGVENYGPLADVHFVDSVAHILQNYTIPSFYDFASLYSLDSVEYIKLNMDCIFIPKNSTISDSYEIRSEKMNFDQLTIQFNYPNSNLKEFNIWFGGGGDVLRKQIESTKILYPDTLYGYLHYTKPIVSKSLTITK